MGAASARLLLMPRSFTHHNKAHETCGMKYSIKLNTRNSVYIQTYGEFKPAVNLKQLVLMMYPRNASVHKAQLPLWAKDVWTFSNIIRDIRSHLNSFAFMTLLNTHERFLRKHHRADSRVYCLLLFIERLMYLVIANVLGEKKKTWRQRKQNFQEATRGTYTKKESVREEEHRIRSYKASDWGIEGLVCNINNNSMSHVCLFSPLFCMGAAKISLSPLFTDELRLFDSFRELLKSLLKHDEKKSSNRMLNKTDWK